jgi:hypothetical protein
LYKYIKDGTLKKRVEAILATGKPELVWLEEKKPPSNPAQNQAQPNISAK